jgi:hypothetical protein
LAKLKLVKKPDVYGGRCRYADFGFCTETERSYGMDKWFFNVPPLGFICTAWKEILTLDGHLPPHGWSVSSLPTPSDVVQGWSFAFDEPFDEAGRVASEALSCSVSCDPGRRTIQIVFGECSQWTDLIVSPHRNFLIGADPDRDMRLSTVFLLDVEGFPDLASHAEEMERRKKQLRL